MSTTRNIKLTLEYDGTDFNGWQMQDKSKRTVQGEIEKALSKILKKKTAVTGSGRTDSGVHAKAQTANFKTTSKMTPFQVIKALNALLPKDVSVVAVQEVPLNFHARYSVKSKIYRYTILNRESRSPLTGRFSLFYPRSLNLFRMRKEARILIGRKDFRSFQAVDSALDKKDLKNKNTIRAIRRMDIRKNRGFILIDIEANGFLYKMVRNIVGSLLEIGSGKRPLGSMKDILNKKSRLGAGQTAPAKGLCLLEVKY